jgi:3-hexulose-6-phosphate synthase
MKLQLALDMLKTDEAVRVAELAAAFVDIIEVGTPLLKHEGLQVVWALRKRFPKHEILVDLKCMDVGRYEAGFCFEEGADIVTVLGVAHDNTIRGAAQCAHEHGKKVMVDCIQVSDLTRRTPELERLGVDILGVHSGIDQQQAGISPLQDFLTLKQLTRLPVAVAGGLNLKTIDAVAAGNPAIVVVGGAITSAEDPAGMARQMRQRLQCASH